MTEAGQNIVDDAPIGAGLFLVLGGLIAFWVMLILWALRIL
ncbi:hypothetical protein [Sphingomonas sp. MMS24-J13]